MFTVRPLRAADIPRLAEIRPAFTANTVIRVEKIGMPPFTTWALREEALSVPFHKGSRYDFDEIEQANIRTRWQQDNTLLEVVEHRLTGQIVGILDIEEESWRSTVWVWNIMLDTSVRGQGLGRQLMERAFAWGRSRRLRAVLLETQSNNTPACHFYARMGFKLIGINDMFYTNDDLALNEVALFWGYPLD